MRPESDKGNMKTLSLILVSILFTSLVSAQIRTGGGGGPDTLTEDQKVKLYEEMQRLKFVFVEFSKELKKVETKCTGRKSFPAKYNFIDSFYTLILKKQNDSSPINEVDCNPTKKTSNCLQNKNLKKIIHEINQTSGTILYQFLETEYKLEKKDAKVIIEFFIDQ